MEEKNQTLWQAVLGELELTLSKASFTTWLKNTFIVENEDGRVVIAVPNTFSQAWLKQKYHQHIYKIIQNNSRERIKEVIYKVQTMKGYQEQMEQAKKIVVDLHPIYNQSSAMSSASSASNRTVVINPKYTFASFVVGKANELAHAAAKAVADNPGKTYNPLFIYGGVGLGKTHLMHAIGNEVQRKTPSARILYVTCEQFTNDYVNSISTGRMEKFTQTYRSPDILMVDDIQFLTGKEGTQEAFFHTFNELHGNNKQVVMSSDRPPKAIATIEDRLLTRFEWGMIADISQPDIETRKAILKAKCAEKNVELEEDIIHFITLNIQNNIRELEGALNKIIAYQQLNKMPLTLENIKKILFSLSSSSRKNGAISPKQLIDTVCEFYELHQDEITGKSREKRLAYPRQIIMFLLREEVHYSYPTIGQELGGRDHTTAMHAYEKISRLLETDEKLRQEVNLIKQKLYTP
jgi:chromosomal replication initiator protein